MSAYRILVTGTREELTVAQAGMVFGAICDAVIDVEHGVPVVLVHGACPTGVDALVESVADDLINTTTEQHPADWQVHGRAAGPIRNAAMVALGADLCLAFPRGTSRGTRGCAALAIAAGIPTEVVEL